MTSVFNSFACKTAQEGVPTPKRQTHVVPLVQVSFLEELSEWASVCPLVSLSTTHTEAGIPQMSLLGFPR